MMMMIIIVIIFKSIPWKRLNSTNLNPIVGLNLVSPSMLPPLNYSHNKFSKMAANFVVISHANPGSNVIYLWFNPPLTVVRWPIVDTSCLIQLNLNQFSAQLRNPYLNKLRKNFHYWWQLLIQKGRVMDDLFEMVI